MKKVHTSRNPFWSFQYLLAKSVLYRFAVAIAAFSVVLTANADILTVTSDAGSGGGSLRAVVAGASAGDIIVFDRLLEGATITLDGTDITIDKDLVIDGSSLLNGITINGNGASRIFEITGGVEVALNSLRLENGAEAAGSGGAIYSRGVLRIVDCAISNNTAQMAGAIDASGSLTLFNSTVSGNTANNIAGVFATFANFFMYGSTVSGNTGIGGPSGFSDAIRFESDGIHNLSIINSTISGNSAVNRVGGLTISSFNSGVLNAFIDNSTITENERTTGAGAGGISIGEFDSSTVTVTIVQSIISGNSSGGQPGDILGNLHPNSARNLVGVGGGLINGNNDNIVGVTDPMLSPLQDNGGPTLTHIPITGSPAVDASQFGNDFDQRGFARPDGDQFEIGSVEGVDHTAARAALNGQIAALNGQIAAQNGAIAALQARADKFSKKAKKVKSKSKSKAKKFKKRARQVAGQIAVARIRVAELQTQVASLQVQLADLN